MSYHVVILRTDRGRPVPIRREEVEAVRAIAGLSAEDGKDGTLHLSSEPAAPGEPLLVWQEGEIWTANPSEATLRRMLELAAALGARVRGDEGETYRTVDETYLHPDDREAEAAARADVARMIRRARRMRILLPILLFGAVALLGLLLGRR